MLKMLLFIFLLATSTITRAAYKWIDEDGNVHYSQSKPPDIAGAQLIKPSPRVDSESAKEELENLNMKLEQLNENRQSGDDNKQAEKYRSQQNCETSKTLLESMLTSRKLRVRDGKGGYRYVTDEEYNSKIDQIKNNITKWCN